MIKVITVLGARPQFIKAAAVSRAFKKYDQIQELIVHTGQHFDTKMSDIFFDELKIPRPNYELHINSLSHGAMTGRMLEEIEKILIEEKPDYVMVYGDTNSTLAGALAASKLHIRVIHVEAGLRSFDKKMPEEINRIVTDHISDILLCPTNIAVQNLQQEGRELPDANIIQNGDVMYDAALYYAKNANDEIIRRIGVDKFALCTIHRAENTDIVTNLKGIAEALNRINQEIKIVLPIHPRSKQILQKHEISLDVEMIDPVGYIEMISLLKHASFVITDSGGLQKEAYFFKKMCITLRNSTEWVELVDCGCNFLAGSDPVKIWDAYKKVQIKKPSFEALLYGDGMACEKIAEAIIQYHN